MRAARREPASPPRDEPMSVWVCRSRSVVRARGAANPGRRSAKMRRGQSGCGQTKRRTATCSRTRRPRQGRSSSRRVYRLCTRRVSEPQRGQAAVGAVVARWTVRCSTSRQARTRRLPSGAPSNSSGSNTRLQGCGSRRVQMVRGCTFYDRTSSRVRESRIWHGFSGAIWHHSLINDLAHEGHPVNGEARPSSARMNSGVDSLDVVTPLEHRHVLVQILLVHPAERAEEVPQAGPQPLQRVAVDLADAVAVVVAGPLAVRVAHRRARPVHRGQAVVPPPFVRIERAVGSVARRTDPLQRRAVGVARRPSAGPSRSRGRRRRRPAAGRSRTSRGRAACSPAAAAGPPGRGAGRLFSPAFWYASSASTSRSSSGSRSRPRNGPVLELVAELSSSEPVAPQLAGQPRRADALGEAAEDQHQLHGPPLRPLQRRPGEGVEDPIACPAAEIEDRGAFAAVDASWSSRLTPRAGQAVRMQPMRPACRSTPSRPSGRRSGSP